MIFIDEFENCIYHELSKVTDFSKDPKIKNLQWPVKLEELYLFHKNLLNVPVLNTDNLEFLKFIFLTNTVNQKLLYFYIDGNNSLIHIIILKNTIEYAKFLLDIINKYHPDLNNRNYNGFLPIQLALKSSLYSINEILSHTFIKKSILLEIKDIVDLNDIKNKQFVEGITIFKNHLYIDLLYKIGVWFSKNYIKDAETPVDQFNIVYNNEIQMCLERQYDLFNICAVYDGVKIFWPTELTFKIDTFVPILFFHDNIYKLSCIIIIEDIIYSFTNNIPKKNLLKIRENVKYNHSDINNITILSLAKKFLLSQTSSNKFLRIPDKNIEKISLDFLDNSFEKKYFRDELNLNNILLFASIIKQMYHFYNNH